MRKAVILKRKLFWPAVVLLLGIIAMAVALVKMVIDLFPSFHSERYGHLVVWELLFLGIIFCSGLFFVSNSIDEIRKIKRNVNRKNEEMKRNEEKRKSKKRRKSEERRRMKEEKKEEKRKNSERRNIEERRNNIGKVVHINKR